MGINGLPERLVRIRKERGYSRKDLSDLLGMPYRTLTNYENGEREPGHSFIIRIAEEFNVTTDYLLGLSDNPHPHRTTTKPSTPEPYTEEVEVAKYNRLDRHGKQVVCAVIAEEEKRMDSEYQRQEPKEIYPLSKYRKYLQTASAGYGDFNDDASYDVVDLVKRPPLGTSFLITINGDSMEPTYHDGDSLFIRAQEALNVGDIGLFAIGPDLYVKEYRPDGLISHNPKYPIKTPGPYDICKIYGKVLGVCTDDYFGK